MALQMTWQQQHQRRRKGGLPLGLKNLGNSCYLNSVLQCLTFTPPLAQFCLSSHHSSLCKSVFANRDKECPFCILEQRIVRSLSLEGAADAPTKIQKCLTVFAEHFCWGRQEDAHEFLRYVIDACHNTCLRLLKRLAGASKGTVKGKESDLSADGGPSTIMKEIFGGQLLSQVKCLSCKGESNKTDEIMDISLDLYQSNTLKDALARFFHSEVLDGNNKYSCEKCKKLCVAKRQMFLLRAPNVLVIQLKRFEGVHGKINRNIEFEEVVGLSKFMYDRLQDSQPDYNLFGSIVHSGYSLESGHYYAYIKDALGRWYCCNDAHVSLSSTQEVLSEKAYILFYLRNNQNPKPRKTASLSNEVKPSDSNGCGISPCQMPIELLNSSSAKLNGSLSARSNGATILKNGKVCSSPQIKSINMKNFELKRVAANGGSNLGVHDDPSVEKCSDSKQYSCSIDENEIVNGALVPSVPNGSATNGDASSKILENNKKQKSNGNGSIALKVKIDEDTGSQNAPRVNEELDCHHSVNCVSNNYGISVSKRKLCDAERGNAPVIRAIEPNGLSKNDASLVENSNYRKQSPDLSTNDSSCARNTYIKQFPEEIEKFKEVLAREAYLNLHSCDWYDKVYKFVRTRKRLCIQETGSCPNNNESMKLLKNDAKKTFASQIPESLKAHLIEQLLSFYQGK